MTEYRRINVFHRSDGSCVHNKSWGNKSTTHSTADDRAPSPEILWPLVQVFLQFSREVQGGSAKRLVFRNPKEYAPTEQRFRPAPQRRDDSELPPIVVHIAHDELFVVAVTESHTAQSGTMGLGGEREEHSQGLTMAEFCESVLDFLNREQTAYVSMLVREDLRKGESPNPRMGSSEDAEGLGQTDDSFGTIGSTSSSASAGLGGLPAVSTNPTSRDALEGTSVAKPMVTMDDARLSEFIAKTQNLMGS